MFVIGNKIKLLLITLQVFCILTSPLILLPTARQHVIPVLQRQVSTLAPISRHAVPPSGDDLPFSDFDYCLLQTFLNISLYQKNTLEQEQLS